MLTLFEGNNMKLKFDYNDKKLIFVDDKGYSYNINFEEKQLLNNNSTINNEQKIENQIKQVSNIIDQIQSTGKIGPCGPQGERGLKGDKGEQGEKGDKGDGLKINYYVENENKLNFLIAENGSIALEKNTLNLFYRNNNNWCKLGNLKGSKGDNGEIGLKGDKGDKGDGLIIDNVINSISELINQPDSYKYILVKTIMDLYHKNKDGVWNKIGNIKGEKGDKGLVGPKGVQGNGIKIDYIYKNEAELIGEQITPNRDDYVLFSDNGDIYCWKDKWLRVGKINLNISNNKKQIITECEMIKSNINYENIDINELKIIKFTNYKTLESWISFDNYKLCINEEGSYKIKYNFNWEIIGDKLSCQSFLKSGVLMFVYDKNKLIKNSVKFFRGYPYINSCIHEFIVNNVNNMELVFVIHLIDINSKVSIIPYSDGSYLEIEKI